MDNIILNLFALISFILIIKYIWYPIMVSAFKDKMFSIRLEYRDHFYNNNIDMNTIAYKSTYDYINNIIRYAENYSFFELIYKLYLLNKHQDIMKEIQATIDNELSELSEKDKEYVIKVRKDISDYLLFHIIRTSFMAVLFMVFIIIYTIIVSIFRIPKKTYLSSEQISYIVSH